MPSANRIASLLSDNVFVFLIRLFSQTSGPRTITTGLYQTIQYVSQRMRLICW